MHVDRFRFVPCSVFPSIYFKMKLKFVQSEPKINVHVFLPCFISLWTIMFSVLAHIMILVKVRRIIFLQFYAFVSLLDTPICFTVFFLL